VSTKKVGGPHLPPVETRFKPGQSGNPGGLAKGTRNKLNGDFLKALSKDFDEHGKDAIQKCREDDPSTYVKIIAGLIPRQIEEVTDRSSLTEYTDEELLAIIRGQSQADSQDVH
jgi:hypothetical protein